MGPHTLMKAQSTSPSDWIRICSHLPKRDLQPQPRESDSRGTCPQLCYLNGRQDAISAGGGIAQSLKLAGIPYVLPDEQRS